MVATMDKETSKQWILCDPKLLELANEYQRRYGFIWTDERGSDGK